MPILSFFTGAGFLDIGFNQAGFQNIIWRNESNPSFARGFQFGLSNLYGLNIDYSIPNQQSIVNIEANQIAREAFQNTELPDIFGVIGGPPCPDFSIGGKNLGKEGNYGKLSLVYIEKIIALQPTFFLLENVSGLLGIDKHRLFFNELKQQLRVAGYSLSYSVLNALDFGVPQNRNRVFLVGFLKKWLDQKFNICIQSRNEKWFPWPKGIYPDAKNSFNWPKEKPPFGGQPGKPEGIPDELMVGPCISIDNWEAIANLPNGRECFNPRSDKFSWIPEGDDGRKSFKRLHRWRYSPSVAYGNNEVHLHPSKPRRLTVREAMRIQTVPDAYVFPADMTLSDKFKMISNGVPVKLAKAVADSLAKVLRGEFNENILAGQEEIITDGQQLSLFSNLPLQ